MNQLELFRIFFSFLFFFSFSFHWKNPVDFDSLVQNLKSPTDDLVDMSALYGKQAPPCKRSLNESKRRAIEPRGWTRYSNGDIHVQSFPRATIGGYSRSSRAATYERERGQLSVPLVHTRLDAYIPQYPTPCATANVPKNGTWHVAGQIRPAYFATES